MSRLFRLVLVLAAALIAVIRQPAEARFMADLQEPAPEAEPASARTDTWSGRAIGS